MSTEKTSLVLQWIIRAAVAVILLIPLVVHSGFFFPFVFPKNIAFRFFVEIALCGYLALAIIDSRFRPRFDLLTYLLLGFWGIAVFSGVIGLNFTKSLWGNYERMGGLIHLTHVVAYFFVLTQVFRRKTDWQQFFSFSLFAGLLIAMVGWAQHFGANFILSSSGGSRVAGTMGNAAYLAAYLLFQLFIIGFFAARPRRLDLKLLGICFVAFDVYLIVAQLLSLVFASAAWGWFNWLKFGLLQGVFESPVVLVPLLLVQVGLAAAWYWKDNPMAARVFLGMLFVINAFILFHTQTRGALLGLFLASVVLAGYVMITGAGGRTMRNASFVGLGILIVIAWGLFAFRDTAFVENVPTLKRLASISTSEITSQNRLLTWQASVQSWTAEPKTFLFGVGVENYAYAFNKNFPVEIFRDPGSQIWFDRAHNIILDTGIATGIIGLAVYIGLLLVATRNFFVMKDESNWGLSGSILFIGLLIAYVTQNMFVFDTVNTDMLTFGILAFASYAVYAKKHGEEEGIGELQLTNNAPLQAGAIVGAVFALVVMHMVINVPAVRANQSLYAALSSPTATTPLALFKQSLETSPLGRYETREQLGTYAGRELIATDQNATYVKQTVQYAGEQLRKSIEEEPFNVRHYLWLGHLYNVMARQQPEFAQLALDTLTKGIQLSPTRPQLFFERGEAYLLSDMPELAQEDFKHAVDLNPDVVDSNIRLFTLYVLLGMNEDATNQLRVARELRPEGFTENDYRQIINTYARVRDYDALLTIYQGRIEQEPNNGRHYIGLAEVLGVLGRTQEALDAIDRGIEISPGVTDLGKQLRDLLLSENGI